MRLPRPRLSLRSSMLMVAIVALSMGGVGYGRRLAAFSDDCHKRAMYHQHWESMRPTVCKGATPPPEPSPADLVVIRQYHAELAAKYDRSARYPWLPIEPEQPEPR